MKKKVFRARYKKAQEVAVKEDVKPVKKKRKKGEK